MDEVELVLGLVVVRPRLDARWEDEDIHAERGDPERLANLAEDAVAELVDRGEPVSRYAARLRSRARQCESGSA
jgi:hypothetical protein